MPGEASRRVWREAGALLAAGLPWDAVWGTERGNLEALLEGYSAAKAPSIDDARALLDPSETVDLA